MKRLFKNRMFMSVFLSVVLTFAFVFAIAYSATTIGTTISTGNLASTGNLTVSGTASITGVTNMINASTTNELDVSGAFIANNASSTITNLQSVNATVSNTASTTSFFTTYASTTQLTVSGTASTTKLIVGGDSTGGTINGIVKGTCSIASVVITASTSKSVNCSSATGVRTSDQVFVTPVRLYSNFIVTGASSTIDGTIQVTIFSLGISTTTSPVVAADNWNWMAIR